MSKKYDAVHFRVTGGERQKLAQLMKVTGFSMSTVLRKLVLLAKIEEGETLQLAATITDGANAKVDQSSQAATGTFA